MVRGGDHLLSQHARFRPIQDRIWQASASEAAGLD